jgi:hypothetical protein
MKFFAVVPAKAGIHSGPPRWRMNGFPPEPVLGLTEASLVGGNDSDKK